MHTGSSSAALFPTSKEQHQQASFEKKGPHSYYLYVIKIAKCLSQYGDKHVSSNRSKERLSQMYYSKSEQFGQTQGKRKRILSSLFAEMLYGSPIPMHGSGKCTESPRSPASAKTIRRVVHVARLTKLQYLLTLDVF